MLGLRTRLARAAHLLIDLWVVAALVALWAAGELRPALALPLLALAAGLAVRQRVTERRGGAQRLQLAGQIEALPLATIAYDGEANVITWNAAAERLFGWTAAEVVGRKNPAVSREALAGSADLHRRVLAGERLTGAEVRRRARDGRELELKLFTAAFAAGPKEGFLALYEDLSERKHVERERDEAQQRYRALVEALPIVTYIDLVDDNATNLYTSPQIEQLLGWPASDWASRDSLFGDLLHPDDRDRVLAHVRHCNETREAFEDEYRLRHRDGQYVWVRDHSTIVQDDGGEAFARGFLLDITEQKRLEEQLLQAQKMEALGQFAGGIAHDFNNLLTGIGGYAELATAESEPGSRLARSLDGIRSAAAEAASLTARLLAFSRRDVPAQRLLDLNEVVRGTAELLARIVRGDVVVCLELAEPPPLVAADPAQLKQVVLNLAVNARDAMPAGGTLTLETGTVDDRIVLRVRDDGHGMDASTKRRALEPFFTTKEAGKGTGLGLAVVYGVVDGLGGTIAIESEQGVGTTVEVTLPAGEGVAAPVEEAPARAAAGACEGRVLVVEDREVVRQLSRDVLAASGFDVQTAPSGDDALEIDPASFDLVLTDVVMPGTSGPELVTQLRAARPELPVLFMSGYTDDVLDREVLDAPRTGFIRKPFGSAELVRAVRELLETSFVFR
jgi:PAS domain S-box-containing protein